MEFLLPVIGLIVGVLIVTTTATRLNLPAPIVLVLVGFGVSFIPGVPTFAASPDLVLYVLLPPLLFSAAFESSAVAIRQLIRPILQRIFGRDVTLVFSADETAREVAETLARKRIENDPAREGAYSFLTTGDTAAFRAMGRRFLQLPIEEVEHVEIATLVAAAV